MKQRAAKKKQTKKVKAAKAKAKAARRAAASGAAGDDVAMGDAVARADEDVKIAEAQSDAKPAGRAAHALKVQARRALKLKIDNLKGARSKIAKRDIGNKSTRKALSSNIKKLLTRKCPSGDYQDSVERVCCHEERRAGRRACRRTRHCSRSWQWLRRWRPGRPPSRTQSRRIRSEPPSSRRPPRSPSFFCRRPLVLIIPSMLPTTQPRPPPLGANRPRYIYRV